MSIRHMLSVAVASACMSLASVSLAAGGGGTGGGAGGAGAGGAAASGGASTPAAGGGAGSAPAQGSTGATTGTPGPHSGSAPAQGSTGATAGNTGATTGGTGATSGQTGASTGASPAQGPNQPSSSQNTTNTGTTPAQGGTQSGGTVNNGTTGSGTMRPLTPNSAGGTTAADGGSTAGKTTAVSGGQSGGPINGVKPIVRSQPDAGNQPAGTGSGQTTTAGQPANVQSNAPHIPSRLNPTPVQNGTGTANGAGTGTTTGNGTSNTIGNTGTNNTGTPAGIIPANHTQNQQGGTYIVPTYSYFPWLGGSGYGYEGGGYGGGFGNVWNTNGQYDPGYYGNGTSDIVRNDTATARPGDMPAGTAASSSSAGAVSNIAAQPNGGSSQASGIPSDVSPGFVAANEEMLKAQVAYDTAAERVRIAVRRSSKYRDLQSQRTQANDEVEALQAVHGIAPASDTPATVTTTRVERDATSAAGTVTKTTIVETRVGPRAPTTTPADITRVATEKLNIGTELTRLENEAILKDPDAFAAKQRLDVAVARVNAMKQRGDNTTP